MIVARQAWWFLVQIQRTLAAPLLPDHMLNLYWPTWITGLPSLDVVYTGSVSSEIRAYSELRHREAPTRLRSLKCLKT